MGLIKENIRFKRTGNIKKSLKLGGLIPEDIFNDFKKEAWNKWSDFQKTLIGKRIHFKGLKRNPDKTNPHTFLKVEMEILVKDTNSRAFFSEFSIQDAKDDMWYTISPKEKIYILDES